MGLIPNLSPNTPPFDTVRHQRDVCYLSLYRFWSAALAKTTLPIDAHNGGANVSTTVSGLDYNIQVTANGANLRGILGDGVGGAPNIPLDPYQGDGTEAVQQKFWSRVHDCQCFLNSVPSIGQASPTPTYKVGFGLGSYSQNADNPNLVFYQAYMYARFDGTPTWFLEVGLDDGATSFTVPLTGVSPPTTGIHTAADGHSYQSFWKLRLVFDGVNKVISAFVGDKLGAQITSANIAFPDGVLVGAAGFAGLTLFAQSGSSVNGDFNVNFHNPVRTTYV